jgi:hypothetical protein
VPLHEGSGLPESVDRSSDCGRAGRAFLRAVTFGHVRQLDKVIAETSGRACRVVLTFGNGATVTRSLDAFNDHILPRCDSPGSPSTISVLGFAPTRPDL